MQSNREYAIYLSLYSQLYHPDDRIILICCLFWYSHSCTQYTHILINKQDIHVYGQKNINDSKEDSL